MMILAEDPQVIIIQSGPPHWLAVILIAIYAVAFVFFILAIWETFRR